MKIKKLIASVALVSTTLAFFANGGLLITLLRSVIAAPVAKVKILKICQKEGGESHWGGYFAGDFFANVEIVSIADDAAFRETAQRTSKDGKRANLDFAQDLSEVGKEYDCYGKNSLRGKGIVSWWSGFGDNWRITSGIFVLICTLLASAVAFYKETHIRSKA